MLMAILFVTMPACARGLKNNPPKIVKFNCPPELKGNIENLPDVPEGAQIIGNDLGQEWVGKLWRAAFEYRGILIDAKKTCEEK